MRSATSRAASPRAASASSRKVSSANTRATSPMTLGLVGLDAPREERQIPRPRRSDDARQRPRNGHVAGDGHVEEGGVQLRRRRHHPQVAGQRPPQAGTGARAVDRGDGDGGHLVQQRRDLELAGGEDLVGSAAGEVVQVGAGAERPAGAGEHEHANRRVGRRSLRVRRTPRAPSGWSSRSCARAGRA